jgi:nitrate reductase gamma subunit
MSASLLGIAYALLAIFLVGFVIRSVRLARMPVHLRWELAPVPHEKGRGHYGGSYLEELDWWTKPREKSVLAELRYMVLEIVFLKAVWEHNRGLWWFSFPFHFGLYLIIGATALLVLSVIGGAAGLEIVNGPAWTTGSTIVAAGGYGLGTIGAIGLVAKRLIDPHLRDFTSPVALFNLVLLLALCGTGVGVVATGDYFLTGTEYLRALATADSGFTFAAVATAHVGVALLFLAYLPFTKMMHFVAKYFTYHQVRWNDEPMIEGSRMEQEVQRLLAQPVTWAGPHLGADGKRNWVDIAKAEVGK